LSSAEDQATVMGNMYRKFYEIVTCGFSDIRADRQTNKHTDIVIAILCTPAKGKVTKLL